jgi:hypothetical protein
LSERLAIVPRLDVLSRGADCWCNSADAELEQLGQELRAWLARGAPGRLDAILGEPPCRGGRSALQRMREAEVAYQVRAALEAFGDARAFRDAVSRYAGTSWPRECDLAECPHHRLGKQTEHCWRVLKATGGTVPSMTTLRRATASLLVVRDRP